MAGQENITNLLPGPEVIFKKEKRHVSVHGGRVRAEHRGGRAAHATMGQAATPAPTPAAFLKKGRSHDLYHALRDTNHARAADLQHHQCQRRPSLPTPVPYPPSERDRCGVDWLARNVDRAKEAGRRQTRPRAVHEKGGETQDLVPSGLLPTYIFKKNFGRVPSYLRRRQEELVQEEGGATGRRNEEVAQEEENDFSLLTEEERHQLLQGLQGNLKEAQRCLQSLPVVCETRATRHRRDQLEATVADLDRYIFLLENYTVALAS